MRHALFALAIAVSAPAAAQDWSTEVAVTERGYLVGNPQAPVRLISFVSYTCPHCKDFEQQADAELKLSYIHDGGTAVEIRPAIRNNVDLAATLLTSCGPTNRFLGNHEAFFAKQAEWLGKASQTTQAQRARWQSGFIGQQMKAIASDLGFYELMEARGYSTSEIDACLGDEQRAVAISNNAAADLADFSYPGTPSFAVNGKLLDGVHSWESLKPALTPEQM